MEVETKCNHCGWRGDEDAIVTKFDHSSAMQDTYHCPVCDSEDLIDMEVK